MIREADFQTYLYLNNTQYIIYVTDNKTKEKILQLTFSGKVV